MPRRKKENNKALTPQQPTHYHTSSFSLTIASSNISNAGKGVFTNDFIPANTIIDEYYGDVHDISYSSSRYFLEITPTCGIDAFNFPRCYMAMVNDTYGTSRETNCTFVIDQCARRAFIQSTVDILPQSELYISYGDEYWISS
jgi:hypothetical protein